MGEDRGSGLEEEGRWERIGSELEEESGWERI